MKNENGKTIYVGKAKNLKNRARSYFTKSSTKNNLKNNLLVQDIKNIDYIVTESESEALLLEASLIKEKKPIYNIRLKDDKNFPYLKINLNEKWPKVSITRKIDNDGSKYFGPYTSPGTARKNLEIINKIFPWRSCSKKITGNDLRPCLDFFLNRCIAPCTSYCTKEEYDEVILQTILFLEGKTTKVTDSLTASMMSAAKNLEFEKAARCREQINSMKKMINHKSVVSSTLMFEADIVGLVKNKDKVQCHVLHFRGNRIISSESNNIENILGNNENEIMQQFILQYYTKNHLPPKEIYYNFHPNDKHDLDLYLRNLSSKKIILTLPRQGIKKKLIDLAIENANEDMLKNIKSSTAIGTNITEGLITIMNELQLTDIPKRIECYDISHIQGSDIVGSMVVFENGLPKKNKYRRFKIKTLKNQDDYQAINEMLSRRLKRMQELTEVNLKNGWHEKPDLMIIDGGRGQLNAAIEVLLQTGIKNIAVCGLAKKNEEIYVDNLDEPIKLPLGTPGINLLQRIRDEAHRFAITYHRNLRSKRQVRSILDEIPGIGKAKKISIMNHFGTINKLKKATEEDIAEVNGISKYLAEQIKRRI
jgi:excinuclease ABC subunit C